MEGTKRCKATRCEFRAFQEFNSYTFLPRITCLLASAVSPSLWPPMCQCARGLSFNLPLLASPPPAAFHLRPPPPFDRRPYESRIPPVTSSAAPVYSVASPTPSELASLCIMNMLSSIGSSIDLFTAVLQAQSPQTAVSFMQNLHKLWFIISTKCGFIF